MQPQSPLQTGSIGVFDSGFGGLSILRAMVTRLPTHNVMYLGDTANNPYGDRSFQEVYDLTCRGVAFLFSQGCELVVLACNTASSEALRRIQQEFLPAHFPNKRVLGVIIPTAEVAAQQSQANRIGIIATQGTVQSQAFVRELQKIRSDVQVVQEACPMLVPLIEAGAHRGDTIEALLRTYLLPLKNAGVDALILGCTHYGLIETLVQQVAGPNIKVINEGPIVAEKLADYLARHPEIEGLLGKHSQRQFFCTAQKSFDRLAGEFYGEPVTATAVSLPVLTGQ